jgi:hypothetical protein
MVAEVKFFMLMNVANTIRPVALVSFYGAPHQGLLEASSNTYWTAQHLCDDGVGVIDIKSIKSIVMMAPDQRYKYFCQDGTEKDQWYLMEKPGVKLLGSEDPIEEE